VTQTADRLTTSPPAWEPATVHQAVTRQALLAPDAVALVDDDRQVTYAELDAEADAIATRLRELGVGTGHLVPVSVRRSARLAAVLLGVLKCGAAYAAIDHRWPRQRVTDVVRALRAPVVVSDGGMEQVAPAAPAALAGDVCSVFFTSGTTGAPKGVVSTHRAVLRLFRARTFADFGPGRVMVQAAPVPWDAFSLELWGMLTTGGTVAIAPHDQLYPEELHRLVRTAGADTLWLTASLFNLFVDEDLGSFAGLRQVLTGGERLSVPHVRRFLDRYPQTRLLNGYGPVESCVFATVRAIRRADLDVPTGIPIGLPVPGTAVHLLAADGRPADEGEICVAGDGLALGYLDDPAQTAEKFVMADVGGARIRLYRTGDLGRRDGDRVLHFLGRTDDQVKIAGYRVEPAEVEHAAKSLPTITDAAVVPVRDAGGAVEGLALYYVSGPGDPEPGQVQRELAAVLPHYLVPTTVRSVGWLPRTANGKLDRSALAASGSGEQAHA
jgi:D-alanine--poly(phosphoribitol) ligase subunit 1